MFSVLEYILASETECSLEVANKVAKCGYNYYCVSLQLLLAIPAKECALEKFSKCRRNTFTSTVSFAKVSPYG